MRPLESMKTILGLIFAAIVVNACVRFGDSAWRNYQLEDSINQEARFGESKTPSMLRRKVIQLAADQGIELSESDVVVERRGTETYVSLSYAEELNLVPSVYAHDQAYDITMTVQPVKPLADDKK
jgi:hypothetical protein